MSIEARGLESVTEDILDSQLQPIPFGQAAVRRAGTDVTIVGILRTVHLALEAAASLAEEGISAEVIDPRTLVPFDVECVRASVQRTGRLIVVDESFPTCSFASEILSSVVEDDETFASLKGAVKRICTEPVPIPYSPVLEDFVLPQAQDIVFAARQLLGSAAR
jgi:pyruvate dehydrogenase E1 component beta subunit